TPTPSTDKKPKTSADVDAPPPTVAAIKPADVRRVMALVVDDLNLSHEGLYRVAQGLEKLLRDDLQPGDLLAIVRTSGGLGVLQQLTSDRRILEAAVKDVRSRPPGLGMGNEDVDPLRDAGTTSMAGQPAISATGLEAQRI